MVAQIIGIPHRQFHQNCFVVRLRKAGARGEDFGDFHRDLIA